MARLRGKDLAALGLLGTAAMMSMGRGKKGETKSEASSSAPASSMEQSAKILSELGEDSGFRRNEYGDLYRDDLKDMRTRAQEAADDEKIFRATGVRPRSATTAAPTRRMDTRTAAQEAADDAKIFGANAPMEGRTASGIAREARGRINPTFTDRVRGGMKKGGKVKVSSASKRADGIAQRGKTRGRMV
jgi:hypothetical protein